ncbi:MAG: hypothetical protein IJV18_05505, partial [Acidaminococcaceae bacterium]|nr:hypothetical protein [Acidaminococcaceae bacterium]MBQ8491743.1 hypothetical protein [Acidaminococcaceae bacterium]
MNVMMSHCAPCIGANRIQGTKSRKYILITLAVFVNVISNFFAKLKVIKKKRLRKTVSDCYFMDSCACGFETRGFASHGSCVTHHASPLACVLRRTAYRQKFPISFALWACFLDFCHKTVSPR